MQILDDKGKLFGIINIVDFTFLMFVFSAFVGSVWLAERGDLYKDFNPYKREYEEKCVEVLLKNQHDSVLNALKREKLNLEKLEQSIKSSTDFKKLDHKDTLPLKIINISASNEGIGHNITLMLKIKANMDICKGIYYYKGLPLEKGGLFKIKTETLDLESAIIMDLK